MIIPPKLIDRIIDHLHDDPQSLKTCTLVCSGWLAPARFHLLQTLHINAEDLSKLLEDLANTNSTLSHCVKHLKIYQTSSSFGIHEEGTIFEIGALLASLTHLTLSFEWWWCGENDAPFSELDGFKHITHLTLEKVIYREAILEFVNVLSSFTALQSLTCDAIILTEFDEEDLEIAFQKQLPSTLTSLSLGSTTNGFINWLCNQRCMRNVHFLGLASSYRDINWELNSLLSAIGSSLQRLDISLPKDESECDEQPKLDLSNNTELLSITFKNPAPSFQIQSTTVKEWHPFYFQWIENILLSITSTQLTEVISRLQMSNLDDFDTFWPYLNRGLSKPCFKNLKDLVISINHPTQFALEEFLTYLASIPKAENVPRVTVED